MSQYHNVRFDFSAKRDLFWQVICKYFFQNFVSETDCVLDLGAGYGNFINNINCRRKIALDLWPDFVNYLGKDTEAFVGSVTNLDFIENDSVDFVFASNLFEHISYSDFSECLGQLRQKMKQGAVLNILQPNFKYAFRSYFDDYTHISIYTHISLIDVLSLHGFEIIECYPRFLPLSIKSRLPVTPLLIRLYLKMPYKLLGQQMLIRARNVR